MKLLKLIQHKNGEAAPFYLAVVEINDHAPRRFLCTTFSSKRGDLPRYAVLDWDRVDEGDFSEIPAWKAALIGGFVDGCIRIQQDGGDPCQQ